MHIDLYKLLSRRGHGLKSSAAAPSSPANPLFLPRYCPLFYPFPGAATARSLLSSFCCSSSSFRLHLSRRWIQSLDKYRDNFSPPIPLGLQPRIPEKLVMPQRSHRFSSYSPPVRWHSSEKSGILKCSSDSLSTIHAERRRNEKISRDGKYKQVPIISIR